MSNEHHENWIPMAPKIECEGKQEKKSKETQNALSIRTPVKEENWAFELQEEKEIVKVRTLLPIVQNIRGLKVGFLPLSSNALTYSLKHARTKNWTL